MSPRYFDNLYCFLSCQRLRVQGTRRERNGEIRNAICQVERSEVIYCRQRKINFRRGSLSLIQLLPLLPFERSLIFFKTVSGELFLRRRQPASTPTLELSRARRNFCCYDKKGLVNELIVAVPPTITGQCF